MLASSPPIVATPQTGMLLLILFQYVNFLFTKIGGCLKNMMACEGSGTPTPVQCTLVPGNASRCLPISLIRCPMTCFLMEKCGMCIHCSSISIIEHFQGLDYRISKKP